MDLVLAMLVLVLVVEEEVPCNSSNSSMSMMSMIITERKKTASREKIVDRVNRMKAMGRFDGILGWGVELEIIGVLFDFFSFFGGGGDWMDEWVGLFVPIQVSFR